MFKETREMIDSTIYTNGRGEVTAQNVNLAMHGMLDAVEGKFEEVENKVAEIEENGTGGSGALRVWFGGEDNPLTDQQIAENISTYNTMLGGELVPVILCGEADVSIDDFSLSQRTTIPVSSVAIKQSYTGEQVVTVMLVEGSNYDEAIILNPDGSVVLPEVDEPSTPASSGPLRVWISESFGGVLTDSQKSENASTYESIMQNGLQPVILMSIDDTGVEMLLYPTAMGIMPDVGLLINLQSLYEENGVINMVTYPYLLNADGTLSILEV